MLGKSKVWILPSPSPAADWNWSEEVWRDLGKAVRRLR
jgi:hypothetical protein